jgi:hypothetical protein
VSTLTDLSNNKIGDSTREHSLFIYGLFHFSLAICSRFIFLLSCQSLSLQDILIDLLGSRSLCQICFNFQNFCYVQEFSHCV